MSAQCPKTLVQPHTHLWHHLEKLHYKTCCPTAQERYCTQRLPVKEVVQALTLWVLLRRMFGLRVEVSWDTDRESSRGRGDVKKWRQRAKRQRGSFVVIWDTLRRTKVQRLAAVTLQERDIIGWQRSKDSPSTRQHIATSLTWSLTMLTVGY